MKRSFVIDALTLLFVGLFGYAAVSKLFDYDRFIVQLSQSPLLTEYATTVAWLVPTVELVTVAVFITVRWRLIAFYLSLALMIAFSAYIVAVTQFSDYVPCSCGGVLEKLSWNQHLVFNLVFVALAAVAIVLHGKETRQAGEDTLLQ